jgi:hypothetical protein
VPNPAWARQADKNIVEPEATDEVPVNPGMGFETFHSFNGESVMKIAFLAVKNIIWGGGIEKYTSELGSRLARRGHDVTVYTMRHYGDVPQRYLGMRIVSVPSFAAPCLQKLSCSATAAINSSLKKYDIVHFHSFAPGAFAWLPRLRGAKCVLQVHGLGLEWKRRRWGTLTWSVVKILEKLALSQSHINTAVSRTQCSFYRTQRGVEMKYIPTAAEVKPKTEAREIYRLGLEPNKYIFFACRLVPEKGVHYLVSAFRLPAMLRELRNTGRNSSNWPGVTRAYCFPVSSRDVFSKSSSATATCMRSHPKRRACR